MKSQFNLHSTPKSYSYSFLFILILFSSFVNRAEKQAAWQKERLRTLEKDAAVTQQMIQTMHDIADDLTEKNEVIFLN